MIKYLVTLCTALLCCILVEAQPLVRQNPPHGRHHTQRLPGVNERRLARLEKMRNANVARRHQYGPLRVNAQPQTKRGLVLLVEFSDESMKSNAATQWNNRFNQQGFSLNSHVGSVRDYFIEQSYGLLTIDFDVIGPIKLSQTRKYYGSAPNSRLDDRAPEMVIEALKLVNSQVNYADYDWDGDGEVDQVYCIYAGVTYSQTPGYIWPHEWALSSATYYGCGSGRQRLDGVYIDTYAVSNELETSSILSGIGTACHEFSHCLGFPDFYDTEYSGGAGGQNWDLLDCGNYNGPQGYGEIPSPYTAYERWSAGWIDLIPLTEPCMVTDMPAINEEGVAYIIRNSGTANEYYILENRQKVTFGTGNRGHGLMVWHIDYDPTAWSDNTVNADKNHQRMTFLPADGKVGTLSGSDYEGYMYTVTAADEAGDPYPGSKKVKNVPQLTWFKTEKDGTKQHANLVHGIKETADGKISFIYGDCIVLPTPEPAMPTDISEDGFTANWMPVDGADSYTLQIEAMTGGAAPATILEENFSGFASVNFNSLVSNSVVGKYMQTQGWAVSNVFGTKNEHVCIGSSISSGYIMTPTVNNATETVVVEFDAASNATGGSSVVLSVLNGGQAVATKTIPLTTSRATYSLTFEGIPAGCNIKLATTAREKRFYLYNVKVMDMSGVGSKVTTVTGITSTSHVIMPIDSDMYYYRVRAVSEDGNSEWSEWMTVDIASSINDAPMAKTPDDEIYDLAGHRLSRVPQRGIYIRGGKTYIAR